MSDTKKSTKKSENAEKRPVGRPRAEVNVPNKKFTFTDLVEANPELSEVTLHKFLARDRARKSKSEIVRLKDESREPSNEKGLGRKKFVYIKRTRLAMLTEKEKAKESADKSTDTVTDASASTDAPSVNISTPATDEVPATDTPAGEMTDEVPAGVTA